jgi:flagellar basal-body rod modification protein FlgD
MSLLLAELQSQDPTAPMDTTQMVGQMVSLNQLDELISIQGILQNSLGSGTAATSSSTGSAQSAQHSASVASTAHSAISQQSTNPWLTGTTAPTSNTQFSNGAN